MPAKKSTAPETNPSHLQIGKKAPAFSLHDGEGKTVKLGDFKGKKLVIYFYPKDMTPGCTTEACAFRDDYDAIRAAGAEVVGVSTDDPSSHARFSEKYQLPFPLLSDPEHAMIEKYGAWAEKSMYGKKYWGVARMTYILDEDGKVLHVFPKVKPADHSREVLEILGKS